MKIIFDSEEQKNAFMRIGLGDIITEYCPGTLHLHESNDGCCGNNGTCKECWDKSGLEMEVMDNE